MTPDQWAQQQTGLVLKIPKGTRTGRTLHWYQLSTGQWVQDPKAHGESWDGLPRRMEYEETTADQYVELAIDGRALAFQALKAIKNRSGKSFDGPISIKRRR